MRDLEEKAMQAREKKAGLGLDIDLGAYPSEPVSHDYVKDLGSLSEDDKKRMILAGVDAGEKDRSGTYIQKDTAVIHAHAKQEGLEVMPIKEALGRYGWLEDYYWKLVAVDTD
ncbi:MAG: SufD family Fe-S cluster assembly protein, partial [Deltaproteobacteria bacterium]